MAFDIAPELDRQLGEQRANAEGLATRAGLLIAATAALVGLAASTPPAQPTTVGYLLIGLAAVLGMVVFWMARLGTGPSPSALAQERDESRLATSKLILLEANSRVLERTQVIFTLQVLSTVAGVAVVCLSIWQIP